MGVLQVAQQWVAGDARLPAAHAKPASALPGDAGCNFGNTTTKLRDQRFENCVPFRAPCRPYFLRSFMRESRVNAPPSRSAGKDSLS